MSRRRIPSALALTGAALLIITVGAGSFAAELIKPGPTPAGGKLVGQPTVTDSADGLKIVFEVDKPVDVTVTVAREDGTAVRRLVSGMVGLARAAAPIQPNSLRQELVWDKTDDQGKAVPPGKYTVQIGVGLGAKLEKFLLSGRETFLNNMNAVCVSEVTGGVFVSNYSPLYMNFIKEFDRDGKYVRTVWPVNPNIDKELLAEMWSSVPSQRQWVTSAPWGMRDYDGRWVLRSVHGIGIGGPMIGSMVQAGDGGLIATTGKSWSGKGFHCWDRHGRIRPQPKFVNLPWAPSEDRFSPGDALIVAKAPDGKSVFVADAGRVYKGRGGKPDVANGYVVGCFDAATLEPVNKFRYSGLKQTGTPTYVLGTPNEPGDDESHFKKPTGVAVAADGRICVADSGSGCLKLYDSQGKYLKRIDNTTPGLEKLTFSAMKLGIHTGTGAVYLATAEGRAKRTLYKLKSLDEPEIVWQAKLAPLTGRVDNNAGQIAVAGKHDIVWVAEGAGRLTLLRITDKGDSFEKLTISGLGPGTILRPMYMRCDSRGNLYVLDHARQALIKTDADGQSFQELIKFGFDNSSGYFCLDGQDNIYLAYYTNWGGPFILKKFDANGKPLKIGDKDQLTFDQFEKAGRVRGVFVADNGDIYVAGAYTHRKSFEIMQVKKEPINELQVKSNTGWIDVYSADGELKKEKLIQTACPNDIQIGPDGGIYTVDAGFPASSRKKAAVKFDKWSKVDKLEKYSKDGGVHYGEGHQWSHYGVGYVNSICCVYECPGAQLDIDADGLIWMCEQPVYNVKVLDSAGNLITRIGTYGNADCDGPGGKNPIPDIPLAWPLGVARYKDFLFVSDQLNACIVKCRLTYAQQKAVPVEVAGPQ